MMENGKLSSLNQSSNKYRFNFENAKELKNII